MISQHLLASRKIVERIVVEGDLVLQTPAHFGGGEEEGTASLSLLRDPYDGAALLPGPSIAGALRSYWRERTWGYGARAGDTDLFGAQRGAKGAMEGHQSLLIVEDAFGPRPDETEPYPQPQVEIRDGVKIKGETRTAEKEKLFDMEALRAGTRFRLRFELLVPEGRGDALRRELALALEGLEQGEIGLGARKRRGLGRCKVDGWQVWRYDLTKTEGLLDWLAEGRGWSDPKAATPALGAIGAKLDVKGDALPDLRDDFRVEAKFSLDGSLLVRSGQGRADQGADAVHLHRLKYGDDEKAVGTPVLPGTSLAGVLRAQGLRIAKTLARDPKQAQKMIDHLFGMGPEDAKKDTEEDAPEDSQAGAKKKEHLASRLLVHETEVKEARTLAQTRIRVDRFTGGAMDGYLFTEEPVFGGRVKLKLLLREPKDYEIGLLLLLLKDLWTGDLPVGGESGMGRGRLKGVEAELWRRCRGRGSMSAGSPWHRQEDAAAYWKIEADGKGLKVTAEPKLEDAEQSLEGFVGALAKHLAGEVTDVPQD